MHQPVMQQEWQRRQSQRSVWMLLGLLAVVSATAPLPAATVIEPPAPLLTSSRDEPLLLVETSPTTSRAVSQQYWRHVAPAHDQQARLTLGCQAAPCRQAVSLTRFLRRFVRPPTR